MNSFCKKMCNKLLMFISKNQSEYERALSFLFHCMLLILILKIYYSFTQLQVNINKKGKRHILESMCIIFIPLVVQLLHPIIGSRVLGKEIDIYCQNNLILNDSLAVALRE